MKGNKEKKMVKCPFCGKLRDKAVICSCEVKDTGMVEFWK